MLTVESLTVDAADPARLAAFWAALLGWTVHVGAEGEADEGEVWIEAPRPASSPDILFLPSTDQRPGKNRLHLDLRPDDRDAQVERALELGAAPVDIGQSGEESWVVLADPEGNEFCILQARPGA
ncbi:MAG: VOC family protein [Actinomycetota bacterium]|nr:VOC family protein [Actinomycetota bacterium]